MLHNVSDATIALAAVWFLIGWVLGLALALVSWWRPISTARRYRAELRRVQQQLEDSDRQLTAVHAQASRLALKLVDQQTRTLTT